MQYRKNLNFELGEPRPQLETHATSRVGLPEQFVVRLLLVKPSRTDVDLTSNKAAGPNGRCGLSALWVSVGWVRRQLEGTTFFASVFPVP
jgi:hypothetical protein